MPARSSAAELRKMIDKAIEDHEITNEEYDRLLHLADADGHIDAEERALLRSLQDMIENKIVRRVAGH